MPSLHRLKCLEHNVLGALPKHALAERTQLIGPFDDRQKMISGELAGFAGEADVTVSEQDFGLMTPPG
jgi:hypothetical protein